MLASFILVLPCDRLAPARRRLPVDDASLVTGNPFTEPLEQTAFPRSPHRPESGLASANLAQRQGTKGGGWYAGVYSCRPREIERHLPPGKPQRTEEADRRAAALANATPDRPDGECF